VAYDPGLAKQLLAEAGFPGVNVLVEVPQLARSLMLAELVALNLKDVGINAEIKVLAPALAFELREAGKFQTTISALAWALDDPDVILWRAYGGGGSLNYPGYSSPKFDELLKKQSFERDPAKRRELVFELQRILDADSPRRVLLWDTLWQGVRDGVQGYTLPQSVYARANFADVWLKK
jgi:peptide/nickel transport system substrate-binding protein